MNLLQRDFEKYGSLRSKLKTFEEVMSLKELTMSEDYLKLLKDRDRFEARMKRKRKLKKLMKEFPL